MLLSGLHPLPRIVCHCFVAVGSLSFSCSAKSLRVRRFCVHTVSALSGPQPQHYSCSCYCHFLCSVNPLNARHLDSGALVSPVWAMLSLNTVKLHAIGFLNYIRSKLNTEGKSESRALAAVNSTSGRQRATHSRESKAVHRFGGVQGDESLSRESQGTNSGRKGSATKKEDLFLRQRTHVSIDDTTLVPVDLFAAMLQHGSEARDRQQHRRVWKRDGCERAQHLVLRDA